MFEAVLAEASILKKVLDAIKDLVNEANFECNSEGINLQAMDTSHVALVSLYLQSDGFESYRCDRSISLGINIGSLTKIMRCANTDDKVTMRSEDESSTVTFIFEDPNQDRVSQFTLKLMEINQDKLGIPAQEYKATVDMASNEFQRISRDLSVIGDSVTLAVIKNEVRFSTAGDIGDGNITIKQGGNADDEGQTVISVIEPVTSTFALKYLINFTKATSLSSKVQLQLIPDLPLCVQYKMESLGFIRYYLAPKIDEDHDADSQ